MTTRPAAVLLLSALLSAPLLVATATPAAASCVGPSLAVEPASAPAGSPVTVTGQAWAVFCADTGNGPAPADRVALAVVQGSRTVSLGTVQAGLDLAFREVVRLPADLAPGAAEVTGTGKDGRAAVALTVAASLPLTGTDPVLPVVAGAVLLGAAALRRRA